MAVIPQRELRNNVSEVLRRAESGERLTVTVDGRPVAELGPLVERSRYVGAGRLREILAENPADPDWADELAVLRAEEYRADEAPGAG